MNPEKRTRASVTRKRCGQARPSASLKKGDEVYVEDAVGASFGLRRGSKQIIASVARDGITVKLVGWVGGGFCAARFTKTPPRTKILYSW